MPEVFTLAEQESWSTSHWVVIGKGPTFSAWKQQPNLPRIALNHSIQALPSAELVHCVDLEVLTDCESEIEAKSDFLLMPWEPNRNFQRERHTLTELESEFPLLSRMKAQHRLLWYHRTGSATPVPNTSPPIPIRYFSVEGAIGVLARAGVQKIFTAGIDGGNKYASEFHQQTPLENGRCSFDDQFTQLRLIQQQYGFTIETL